MVRVLKIGGSILTDKGCERGALPMEIERVAREVASRPHHLVLVHGAGSFGHIPAKQYGLPQRFSPEGLRVTHESVVRLNRLVLEALAKAGVEALPVHPLSCLILSGGRIESFATEPIKKMLEDGIMPILHGDVAMDLTQRAGIVSGDQLVSHLARALKAEVVAVGCNVDGVLFSGRPMAEVKRSDLPLIEGAIGGSAGIDVTGGMKGKLDELLDLADMGMSSMIFNGSKEGNIVRALRGEAIGTKVWRPD
jgi:isopentenyl phosphate kinase